LCEDFIATDLQLLQDFSNIEWTRLIHVVINCFRLLSIAIGRPREERTSHQLAQFASLFDRLAIRMKEAMFEDEESKNDPNMFLLFDSVLPVMKAKYTKMVSKLTAVDAFHIIPTGPPTSLASLCPIVNGSVKNTEYWDTLIDENADNFHLAGGISFEDNFWMQELDGFGDLSSLNVQDNSGSYI
jgi:hypothetical protein